jgi:hypothetical protein
MKKTKNTLPVALLVLDHEVARMLRELSELRAERLGGRPNQSATIRDLVRTEAARRAKEEGTRRG